MTAAAAERSAESLLVVVPPESGGVDGVCPSTMVAGLPLVRRVVLAGAQAGFGRILARSLCVKDDALAGTGAAALTPGESLPPLSRLVSPSLPPGRSARERWRPFDWLR